MNNLISLKNSKHINIVNKINNFNSPEFVYIPAKKITKTVKMNDYIYKNTFFDDYIVSISGKISGVKKVFIDKKNSEVLVIENDYEENILKRNRKKKIQTKDDLIKILKNNYLNGIAVKIEKLDKINNLVISSIDEEIYSAKEFVRLANNYEEILNTINLIMQALGLKKSQIVTKNTNFKSIKNVKSIIGTYPNIEITLTPDKYLISKKTFLCSYLNLDVCDTLILTTNDVYKIYLLMNGMTINETLITISGDAINKGVIINTRLGVSLNELLKEYVELITNDYEIFVNGEMFGYKINSKDNLIITNDVDFVVINKKENNKVFECINCGACLKICPANINVKRCFQKGLESKKCIGCGLCNYICPANIDLKKIVKSDSIEKNGR